MPRDELGGNNMSIYCSGGLTGISKNWKAYGKLNLKLRNKWCNCPKKKDNSACNSETSLDMYHIGPIGPMERL